MFEVVWGCCGVFGGVLWVFRGCLGVLWRCAEGGVCVLECLGIFAGCLRVLWSV